ncbi:dihydroxyacetone kinase subunit DhaL [Dactylosporangium sucinum]|uniref:Dihydroxyacetone kinase n=1 Tax=Dactylosporangium sucinum TaxID=1424081 RepID=A0A917TSC5_9ACTN|nr:dihydroxyacetone kinase subunit DhaL [Dactylosporangium sucinum]GGM35711.1 dihydroxyacetone kinase [Dactylosporangium sucinum]
MQALRLDDARSWVARFIERIEERHQELTDLDRRAGDGDYGTNVRSALRRAQRTLENAHPDTVAEVFAAVSDGFLRTGGTSGPLFGMWFREFARAAPDGLTAARLALAAGNALAAVQRLGHAEPGHKTMVDAMAPAAAALAAAAADDEDVLRALARAASAARAGAESTAQLTARRGRASYVGDHAVGVIDPGALTVAVFFESALSPASAA